MVFARQASKGIAKAIGFSFTGILLIALVCVDWAAAQDPNTAYGTGALSHNTTGTDNSAFGFATLFSNTTGGGNTASGVDAPTRL